MRNARPQQHTNNAQQQQQPNNQHASPPPMEQHPPPHNMPPPYPYGMQGPQMPYSPYMPPPFAVPPHPLSMLQQTILQQQYAQHYIPQQPTLSSLLMASMQSSSPQSPQPQPPTAISSADLERSFSAPMPEAGERNPNISHEKIVENALKAMFLSPPTAEDSPRSPGTAPVQPSATKSAHRSGNTKGSNTTKRNYSTVNAQRSASPPPINENDLIEEILRQVAAEAKSGAQGAENEMQQTDREDETEPHEDEVEKEDIYEIDEAPGAADKATVTALEIYRRLAPTDEEIEKKIRFVKRLKQDIQTIWSDAKLYMFGSSANNFSIRGSSDIDVCLSVGNHASGLSSVNDVKRDIVSRLAQFLAKKKMMDVLPLVNARVPIVKFKDRSTGFSCDLCVNNMLAVHNTKLLADYARIDERFKQLVFVIKHWAKKRRINEPYHGTLSSYGYVLMIIHYLQVLDDPVLPVLQDISQFSTVLEDIRKKVRKNYVESKNVTYFNYIDELRVHPTYRITKRYPFHHRHNRKNGSVANDAIDDDGVHDEHDSANGSNTTASTSATATKPRIPGKVSTNAMSLGELLIGFFRFYSCDFNYKKHVVTIRHTRVMTKRYKGWAEPAEQRAFFCIEDPFETDYNVARVVSKKALFVIRHEIQRAYSILAKTGDLREACKEVEINL